MDPAEWDCVVPSRCHDSGGMLLWLYRLFFLPALVVLGPGYLRRMRRRGGYRSDFGHRFGAHPALPKQPGSPRIWLQAVSVGEMLAIGPILEALRKADVEVYLTTTTSTGYRLANDRYRGLTVGIGYFPIDWWPFSARTWRRVAPDLVILTEGERWPEHLAQARARGVPVLCVNARLSDRSFSRLRMLGRAARPMVDGVTRYLVASSEDASRFRDLGVPAARIVVTGNIKLDIRIPRLDERERAELRRALGLPPTGLVLLGSSTWPGEEDALVAAYKHARDSGISVSLLLVPRHAERRAELERMLSAAGVRFHLRSRGTAPAEVAVAVGDTTGELRNFTQLADVVFVGKSLAPHTEGQTPVEAAALEKPILFGPGMANFRVIARDLVARGAALEVVDAAGLALASGKLLQDAAARAKLAAAAAAWRQENAGAVERTLEHIHAELAAWRLRSGPAYPVPG